MTRILLATAATFATLIVASFALAVYRAVRLRRGMLGLHEKIGLGDWRMECPYCGTVEKIVDPTLREWKNSNDAFKAAHEGCRRDRV